MVFWMKDETGRFRERPHYDPSEIDVRCERIVFEHLTKVHGKVEYPFTTNDLTVLVEALTEDLNLYADLTEDGPDVEGVTSFKPGTQPEVGISVKLFEDERRSNRARTTIAHELGHVVFHDPLFQDKVRSPDLFAEPRPDRVVCKRDTIVDAPRVDWMEWQAGYASGAFLMPRTAVDAVVRDWRRTHMPRSVAPIEGIARTRLIRTIQERFSVSSEAATVRLTKLGCICQVRRDPTLFDHVGR